MVWLKRFGWFVCAVVTFFFGDAAAVLGGFEAVTDFSIESMVYDLSVLGAFGCVYKMIFTEHQGEG